MTCRSNDSSARRRGGAKEWKERREAEGPPNYYSLGSRPGGDDIAEPREEFLHHATRADTGEAANNLLLGGGAGDGAGAGAGEVGGCCCYREYSHEESG